MINVEDPVAEEADAIPQLYVYDPTLDPIHSRWNEAGCDHLQEA